MSKSTTNALLQHLVGELKIYNNPELLEGEQ